MKNLFKRLLSLTVAALVLCGAGCKVSPDDVNGIIDNAFAKFESMNSTETGEYKNFKDINVESSYLGYGYDVINDAYMDKDTINFGAPILDMSKIENAQLRMDKSNKADAYQIEASTMEEVYSQYSTYFNLYGNAGKVFSGGLKADFSGSNSAKSYWYFYKEIRYVSSFNIYMTDSVAKIREFLSDDFKRDLSGMNAEALFDKYGTHMIKEAVMGGRIEISSTYSSESASASNEIQAAVNAHIKFLGSSINTEADISYDSVFNTENIKANTTVRQVGGALVGLNKDNFREKQAAWEESFNQSLEYAALCGIVGGNSLLGIWELLPESEKTRADELKNKFIELSGNSYSELCNQFKLKDNSAETGGNGEGDESGGVGEYDDGSWRAKITESLKRVSILDGNKYNPEKINTDQATLDRHAKWELGTLNFYGMEKTQDKFTVVDNNAFSIRFNLLQDTSDLPLSKGISWYFVTNDSATSVYGTNIASQVGKGAYWIRITYSDDTQTQIKRVNCLSGVEKDQYVEFLSMEQIDFDKTLKKIEIVFVYELQCGAPGFLGIAWDYLANFRCDYVMYF